MHDRPIPESAGTFDDWRLVKLEAPNFRCRHCGSDDVWYRDWESSCGSWDDTKYECRNCGKRWWVEGADA